MSAQAKGMTMGQAARLDKRIRKLAEERGYMLQATRPWSTPPLTPPVAVLRYKWWRHSWYLSESALLAECATFGSSIRWDTPPQPIQLHYAKPGPYYPPSLLLGASA